MAMGGERGRCQGVRQADAARRQAPDYLYLEPRRQTAQDRIPLTVS